MQIKICALLILFSPLLSTCMAPETDNNRYYLEFLGKDIKKQVYFLLAVNSKSDEESLQRKRLVVEAVEQEKSPALVHSFVHLTSSQNDYFTILASSRAVDARSIPLIEAFIDEGCDPNQLSMYSCTALHYAAVDGNEALIDLLLEKGMPVDQCDSTAHKETPLRCAITGKQFGAVKKLLCKGASTTFLPGDYTLKYEKYYEKHIPGESYALFLARMKGGPDIVNFIKQHDEIRTMITEDKNIK